MEHDAEVKERSWVVVTKWLLSAVFKAGLMFLAMASMVVAFEEQSGVALGNAFVCSLLMWLLNDSHE